MAKAIRPLAAQEAQEVLSMLSNLGFHQSKITDKQIEFSGDNLPTIYLHNKRTKEEPLICGIVCFNPDLDFGRNHIEGFMHRPSQSGEFKSKNSNWTAFPKDPINGGANEGVRSDFVSPEHLKNLLIQVIRLYRNGKVNLGDKKNNSTFIFDSPNKKLQSKATENKNVREVNATQSPLDDFNTEAKVPEGKTRAFFTYRYEKSPKLRAAVLNKFGYKCAVCGFDFEKIYGQLGKNFIEVHHMVPVSEKERENDVNNLRPLCSNCHRMIHRLYSRLEAEEYAGAIDLLKSAISK